MINYFIALALTDIIECIVTFLFGYRNKLVFLAIICINFITHPVLCTFLNIIYNTYPDLYNLWFISFCECVVVIVEGILLMYVLQENPKKMFLLALLMNLASYVIGLFIFPMR